MGLRINKIKEEGQGSDEGYDAEELSFKVGIGTSENGLTNGAHFFITRRMRDNLADEKGSYQESKD